MGNTNMPQFGAADTDNSRDTLPGDEQLTQKQKEQRNDDPRGGIGALLPDRVPNESTYLVEHADHGRNVVEDASDKNDEDQPTGRAAENLEPTEQDVEALAGHVGTGHSPSGAT